MPTLVLDAISTPYPLIVNRIRAAIYSESAPLAIVASIIDNTINHPQRTWHFPGLKRDNYKFSLDEIDSSGNVITNLALFDVVPSEIDGLLARDDEQIQVGITPGFLSGQNVAVFDGTSGKPNYIGWSIVPSELTGRGILVKDELDYTWDDTTGTLTMLQIGDVFSDLTYWNIHFNPKNQTAGNSYPTLNDTEIVLINVSTVLTSDNFGKRLIVEPNSDYIEVTLPDISTVVEGRPIFIESSLLDTMFCIKIIASNPIKFLKGNIYLLPQENITIYKYTHPVNGMQWRVFSADGNFKTVGQLVSEDAIQGDIFNKQLLNGTSLSVRTYARLYNEYVLHLPLDQVCDHDVWNNSTNKYKYSLDNSSNPSARGYFFIPDRTGLFERNTTPLSSKSGDWQDSDNKSHSHTFGMGDGISSGNWIPDLDPSDGNVLRRTGTTNTSGGNESRPENYSINKYVIL